MPPVSPRSAHWLYVKMDGVTVMSAVALRIPVLMPRDWFHCRRIAYLDVWVVPLVSRLLLAQLYGHSFLGI